ncbi:hypothetical protein PHYBOEH_006726 [Phytophthora boehmeriae]|uniref:TFIIS N-terminal domain-containing protein n=1 Tax=Phytophthora boehmeriae TaxID=109152 RepID=A0A8T1X263_9STRA|nr:hypothetical protein PHYBOEH_006726 [Phytophthora boehmeriae]
MATTGETEVAAMAREISRVTSRDGWKSDKSVVPDMQRLLGQLTTLKVDKNLLQRTKIGAAVNKLKKHDDEVVRGYSTSLTKKWKTEVGISNAKAVEPSSMRPPERRHVPSPSPPHRDPADQKRLENAKKRLQQGYASEKAKRDSRTVQELHCKSAAVTASPFVKHVDFSSTRVVGTSNCASSLTCLTHTDTNASSRNISSEHVCRRKTPTPPT